MCFFISLYFIFQKVKHYITNAKRKHIYVITWSSIASYIRKSYFSIVTELCCQVEDWQIILQFKHPWESLTSYWIATSMHSNFIDFFFFFFLFSIFNDSYMIKKSVDFCFSFAIYINLSDIPNVKGEIRNRFNLNFRKRVKFFKHNSENLMKIGWKIRKLWYFEVSQIFTNFHKTFLDQ